MTVSKKRITEYVSTIANVAQTSHYQVFFSGLKNELTSFLGTKEVDNRFIIEEAGLRCSSASIPGSSLATASIAGNYMGVQEKMVHSRIFTEMSLEFIVDRDYKIIKFFELCDRPDEIFVHGGGAKNDFLMKLLGSKTNRHIQLTSKYVSIEYMEAAAFAYLAFCKKGVIFK